MFIGSVYHLCDQEGRSMLGYKRIVIKDRVLARTERRSRGDSTVTSYHYTLMCLVNSGDTSEITEEDLQDEIISSYYEFCGSK